MIPETALLSYIGLFGLLSASLIARDGRLGWALFFQNITFALAFGYSALISSLGLVEEYGHLRIGFRWLIVLSVTWAICELVCARYLLWKQRGKDPRVIIGRREKVVGMRESLATQREDVVSQHEDPEVR